MIAPDVTVTVQEALEVVRSFHAEFDRAMRQDVALGLLTIAGASSIPGAEREPALLRVGAQMCGMIRDDVHLETFSAKMRLLASEQDAATLQRFASGPDVLARYVLARWHDAAGRVWYRLGNHTRAMAEAQAGLTLLSEPPLLWWCWADVRSNLLRMQQEADTQVRRRATVGELDYDRALEQAERLHAEHASGGDRRQEIEHLRGLWNLHHNRMVTRGPDRLRATLAEFAPLQERLVALVGPGEFPDPYRQAQTLNQEAIQLEALALRAGGPAAGRRDPALLVQAIACYQRLARAPWPRGQFFARQHLPRLQVELAPERREESRRHLLDLCDEARSAQAGPGGREGFDLDRYYWTIALAREIAGADDPGLAEHDLAASRAIQAVACVSAYKNAAQRFVLPSLQRAAERHLQKAFREPNRRRRLAHLDPAMALVEEGSARELLDLLGARREAAPDQRPGDVFVPVPRPAAAEREAGTAGADPAGERQVRASSPPGARDDIIKAVAGQRDREEAYWLGHPLATQGIDPEISHHCRQFSAERFSQDGGPLLLRYFQRVEGDYWAIAYFRGETLGPVRLLGKLREDRALRELLVQGLVVPREHHCRELWSLLLEPILRLVFPDRDARSLARLVVVPCGELFSIPLHVAAVPPAWTGLPGPAPLCHWRPVSFSVSLASHVLRNRAAFRSCVHQADDDLVVLFAGEPGFRAAVGGVLASTRAWGEHGVTFEAAGAEAIRQSVERKPEFLVLQCHGEILDDAQAGSVLLLEDGVLSNFGIATRQWLPRNKLTILGACVSGRPVPYADGRGADVGAGVSPAAEIAGFVRGFIAAGCGGLLVTGWSVLQRELGAVTSTLLERIRTGTGVLQLDALLSEIQAAGGPADGTFDARIERSVFQLYL